MQNPENVDWTKYHDWFITVEPNVIVTKGYELFNSALEMAENDAQRSRINKSMIQVEYIDSYFRSHQKITRQNNLMKVVRGIVSQNLSGKDANTMVNNVMKIVRASYDEEYYNFNLDLVNKMRSFNIWLAREGGHFPANENLKLNVAPDDWY
ncbi:MAG: hypothetical protein IJE40_02120 [Clostridia bacterium]|nr:hypothetical protein [Clostridia bacterium]